MKALIGVGKQKLLELGKKIIISAPQRFVDVDIEADGIAGNGSMLSLGAISPDGETFYSEIRPQFSEYINEHRKFCEKNGLERKRLLKTAPSFETVMQSFLNWSTDLSSSSGKGLVFSAFNASFDWAFVDLYFLKAKIKNPYGHAPFDLKSLTIPFTSKWNWDKTSKSKLPKLLLPDGKFKHNALEDARFQQKIHFALAGLLGSGRYVKIVNDKHSI